MKLSGNEPCKCDFGTGNWPGVDSSRLCTRVCLFVAVPGRVSGWSCSYCVLFLHAKAVSDSWAELC